MPKVRSFLSNTVTVRSGNPVSAKRRAYTFKLSTSQKRRRDALREHRALVAGKHAVCDIVVCTHPIQGLSFEEREQLDQLNGPLTEDLELPNDNTIGDALPPGDEAMLMSNAGGETQLCEDIMANRYVPISL